MLLYLVPIYFCLSKSLRTVRRRRGCLMMIQDQHRARRHLVVCGVDIELVSVSDRGAVTLHQYRPPVISLAGINQES